MNYFQSRLALSFIFFYSLLIISSTQFVKSKLKNWLVENSSGKYIYLKDSNDLCTNCNISEHKRCYNISSTKVECRCLKGLYQIDDKCLGVIRYDMNLTLSYPNSFKSQKKIAEEIAEFFKNIPTNSKESLVNSNYGMNLENSIIYSKDVNPKIFAKLVYWKKDQKNPNDLPNIQLEQMKNFLKNYFNLNSKGDAINNSTIYIDNLDIGPNKSLFIESLILRYNEFTCKTGNINYCYEHKWCKPNLGSVKCECDQMTSVDVSPQKDLFPGEQCNEGCSKKCINDGICRLKEKEFVCYCLGWYVGEYCQISIIWFIIVTISLIIVFLLLSCLCGFFEIFIKKKQKKNSSKQKEEIEDTKEKRF